MSEDEDDVLLPRFFKVFLSESSSESLMIPMSFMEHLHDPLPKTAKLQGTGGGVWTVGWTKIREQAFFTHGWSKFAEAHELKSGEFMTFVYDGHRIFEVSVFGRCGRKETRAVVDTVDLSDSDEDDDEDEETETDVDFVGSTDLEVASKNPCFDTKLKPKRPYELLFPAHVVKMHKLRFGDSIKFVDKEGTIQGERGIWKDERVFFKGWDRICRRNKIKSRDNIKCEILHINKLVHSIKVHVQRVRCARRAAT